MRHINDTPSPQKISWWKITAVFAFLLLLVAACVEDKLGAPESTGDANSPTRTVTAASNEDENDNATRTPVPPPPRATAVPTSDASSSNPAAVASPTDEEGALIRLTMASEAGVLLDELPQDMRDRVADALMEKPDDYWLDVATRQVKLTYNRLHFRPFFYTGKGQLPLPPEALWQIELDEDGPRRQTVDDHDLVLIAYTFSSTLLTDTASPETAETALAEIGGVWEEPFILPLDPSQLLQRTGNACINEGGFPPNSYDAENVDIFYDYACTADSAGAAGCHRTTLPRFSCVEALDTFVGRTNTNMRFERLEWDEELADAVRIGEVTSLETADLLVVGDDLNNNRIEYRYFAPNSCALEEACIIGEGWRRLLLFDATAHNLGAAPLEIGPVVAENPLHNMFQYNACHDHFHFQNYGEFEFGEDNQPSKQAFCVESTSRFSNNELSPLTHDYTCQNQGIQAGWVDEYGAGLDCQWIDITDLDLEEPATMPLTFRFNTDQFLCEGTPQLDEDRNPLWEPTGERTENGLPISRPQCEFIEDWDATNAASRDVTVPPTGSFVTAPCIHSELGPLRNCGFTELPLPPLPEPEADDADEDGEDGENAEEAESIAQRCTPGSTVQMSCSVEDSDAAPQVLRICETSAALGIGIPCTATDALLNRIIGSEAIEISFTCPFLRDEDEPGGDYAFFTAPVFGEDERAAVSCEPVLSE